MFGSPEVVFWLIVTVTVILETSKTSALVTDQLIPALVHSAVAFLSISDLITLQSGTVPSMI